MNILSEKQIDSIAKIIKYTVDNCSSTYGVIASRQIANDLADEFEKEEKLYWKDWEKGRKHPTVFDRKKFMIGCGLEK